MAAWQRRLIGLGLPCLLCWMLDVSLTLHGQPAEYWAGDYTRTTEGGPFFRRLYSTHPSAGVGGQLLAIGLVAILLVIVPEVLAVVVAIASVTANTYGATTWITAALVSRAAWGQPTLVGWYQASAGMFLAASVVIGVGVHWVVRSSAGWPP